MGSPADLSWIKTADAKKWISGLPHEPGISFEKLLPSCTEEGRNFVFQLLEINPSKRMKVNEALHHEFLKEFYKENDFKTCSTFDLSFEFEETIKTSFGVRHMMYEELLNFKKNHQQRPKEK